MSRAIFAVSCVVCGVVLGAWTVGIVISDRYVWSQYLSWMPSVAVLPVAGVLWVVAALAGHVGRGKKGTRWRRWSGALMVGLTVWLGAGVVWVMAWEWRVYRLPLPPRPEGKHLRVLHWNVTAIARNEQITGPLLGQRPDVAVLVNPSNHVSWSTVPTELGGEYQVVRVGGFVVASKARVVRWGVMSLGLEGLPAEVQRRLERKRIRVDPGRAMFLEVDAREMLGRMIVVWVLDMPSEPRLSRWAMAKNAADAIAGWEGAVMMEGGAVPSEGKGFPAADVVVGDFNIVRGAASMSRLLPGMRNAFDEAGAGYGATWPRYGYRTPVALVQIDQMFVSGGEVGVERYEVVDPGYGYHMMQVGDVIARTYP